MVNSGAYYKKDLSSDQEKRVLNRLEQEYVEKKYLRLQDE